MWSVLAEPPRGDSQIQYCNPIQDVRPEQRFCVQQYGFLPGVICLLSIWSEHEGVSCLSEYYSGNKVVMRECKSLSGMDECFCYWPSADDEIITDKLIIQIISIRATHI